MSQNCLIKFRFSSEQNFTPREDLSLDKWILVLFVNQRSVPTFRLLPFSKRQD